MKSSERGKRTEGPHLFLTWTSASRAFICLFHLMIVVGIFGRFQNGDDGLSVFFDCRLYGVVSYDLQMYVVCWPSRQTRNFQVDVSMYIGERRQGLDETRFRLSFFGVQGWALDHIQ